MILNSPFKIENLGYDAFTQLGNIFLLKITFNLYKCQY
jgi:hypothetical protein